MKHFWGTAWFFILFYFSSLGACPFVDRLAAVHRDLDQQRRKKDSASSFARSNRGCKPGREDRGVDGSGSRDADLARYFQIDTAFRNDDSGTSGTLLFTGQSGNSDSFLVEWLRAVLA